MNTELSKGSSKPGAVLGEKSTRVDGIEIWKLCLWLQLDISEVVGAEQRTNPALMGLH